MRRTDAANGLAILLREICDNVDIYTFSMKLKQVPSRRGFALRDAIMHSQSMSGTYLGAAVSAIQGREYLFDANMPNHWRPQEGSFPIRQESFDRLIVITDEQSHDKVPNPTQPKSYIINVATNQNGVGYKPWVHVDGWSEACVKWIQALEMERFV